MFVAKWATRSDSGDAGLAVLDLDLIVRGSRHTMSYRVGSALTIWENRLLFDLPSHLIDQDRR